MENTGDADQMTLYYQIDYTLTDVPADAAYFHASEYRLKTRLVFRGDGDHKSSAGLGIEDLAGR